MSEQKKKYTAQEMRKASSKTTVLSTTNRPDVESWIVEAMAMLRQAADAEEELTKLHDELKDAKMTCSTEKCPFDLDTLKKANDGLYNEVKSLKARLTAVVKECGKWKWADDNWCTSMKDATDTHNRCIDRILRAARDEASGEIEAK